MTIRAQALLARLLRALLVERAASIVITSNYEPDALLPDRRYHHTMLPAIDLIKNNLDVIAIDASVVYRGLGTTRRCSATGHRGHPLLRDAGAGFGGS